jgi:hypothetical protein
MVVAALAALGFATDCDCLRASTESFAGADADADVDACPGTDRYRDCDPDKGTYRCTHLHGNAAADYYAESDRGADVHPDGNGDTDINPGTDGHTYAHADRHTESHADRHTESHGDSDQDHPAYGNSGACLCGLARGILWQPQPGRSAGIGPDG